MFCVQVRRSGWVNVYIDCPDPVLARDMAKQLVDDGEFVLEDTYAAYPASPVVKERVWRGPLDGGAWQYPATGLFERNEA